MSFSMLFISIITHRYLAFLFILAMSGWGRSRTTKDEFNEQIFKLLFVSFGTTSTEKVNSCPGMFSLAPPDASPPSIESPCEMFFFSQRVSKDSILKMEFKQNYNNLRSIACHAVFPSIADVVCHEGSASNHAQLNHDNIRQDFVLR